MEPNKKVIEGLMTESDNIKEMIREAVKAAMEQGKQEGAQKGPSVQEVNDLWRTLSEGDDDEAEAAGQRLIEMGVPSKTVQAYFSTGESESKGHVAEPASTEPKRPNINDQVSTQMLDRHLREQAEKAVENDPKFKAFLKLDIPGRDVEKTRKALANDVYREAIEAGMEKRAKGLLDPDKILSIMDGEITSAVAKVGEGKLAAYLGDRFPTLGAAPESGPPAPESIEIPDLPRQEDGTLKKGKATDEAFKQRMAAKLSKIKAQAERDEAKGSQV